MAPIKQKHIRGNQSPFMNKDIHKAIMTRTRLRNRFLKEPTEMNRLAYKKQRNYCVLLMRQSKKQYYGSLNVNHLTDNKNFWRVVKPNFSNKIFGINRVTLRDGGKIISDTEKVADNFNKFFMNIGKALKIDKDKRFLVETKDVFDPVLKAIKKYSAHPSILRIKDKMNNNVFSFRKVTYEEILIEINSLDTSKSPQSEDIPFKIIKDNGDIFANFILQNFNKCLIDGKFPDQLKKADVSPIFKKGNHNDKTNYRPVSILPSLSKIYKRLIYNQTNHMTGNALSILQCGFRKKYSTQHALIAMIKKGRKILDKSGTFGALLTDLSKVFDCMTRDLLIAKLHALNFDMNALNLIFDYLTRRKQRVKINSSFSSYLDIFQGSILGPLLFNIFLCDLFLFVEEVDIMCYADDNTPYVCSENIDVTLEKLEEVGKVLFEWFSNNFLKANADKCHLILSTDEPFSINIDNEVIKTSNNKKLLGINLNNRLGFDTHVANICSRVSKELHALARISQYMSIHKRRMKMKAFIASEFGYCPLVRMFHRRKLNSRVNKLHERALRIVYQDYASPFTELLEKDNSTTIHNRKIQLLATELFKVKNGLSPPFINKIFVENAHHYYDLRKKYEFKRTDVKTVYNGTETLTFLGPKIWEIVPDYIKKSNSFEEFKLKIKLWSPENCPCRLCKRFLPQVGFL